MRNRFRNLLLILLLGVYGLFLANHVHAYAEGSDASGYMNNVKMLLSGKMHENQRVIEGVSLPPDVLNAYVPLGFRPTSDDKMVPTYPLGLSLIIALLSFIVGIDAASHAAIWLHAMGSIVLIYYFALALNLLRFWAVIAAGLLAINPLFLSYSLQLMSDMPSLFWCGLTVFAALKNAERKWTIICGIAAGMAVLMRPTNILIFIPLLIAFGRNWRGLIYCGLAGLPFAAIFLFINHSLYGQYFTTGYGNLSDLFKTQFVPFSIMAYSEYLWLELSPFVVFAIGIFVPSLWNKMRKTELVIAVWILSFLLFYSFYYYTHTVWWYMRFLLPIFPVMILAMLVSLQSITDSAGKLRRSLIIFFVTFSFFWQLSVVSHKYVLNDSSCFEMSNWVIKNLPKDSVVISMQNSGALFYYTDLAIVRYDHLSADDLRKVTVVAEKVRRPVYAVLHNFEREMLDEKVILNWKKIKEIGQIQIYILLHEK